MGTTMPAEEPGPALLAAWPIPDRLRHVLRALGHRNYRLFFMGQSVSLVGTWMQHTAMAWLVYRLTGSQFMLGAVGFAGQIPMFLFAPLAGVLADRWNRHRLLLVTQVLAMVHAATLAGLVFGGVIAESGDAWMLIVLSVFLGLVNSLDMPVRQAFIVELVGGKEDLGNAIALNSMLMNSSRLVGPSIAGLLIRFIGEKACFLTNAVSYLSVIAALLAIRVAARPPPAARRHLLHELREGLAYAWGTPYIRLILVFVAMVSLVGVPYAVLMPVFAKDVLHGDAQTLGFLFASVGVGAVCGNLVLASRRSPQGLGRLMAVASVIFGLGLVGFSLSRSLWLSMPLLVLIGFGMVGQVVAANTVLQTVVDDDKRGRVMSLHGAAFLGMMPFGSLLAGSLASRIGAPYTVLGGGLICLASTLVFATRLTSLRARLAATAAPGPAPAAGEAARPAGESERASN
jgi:MFS family permease